jgi:hypothetical protein
VHLVGVADTASAAEVASAANIMTSKRITPERFTIYLNLLSLLLGQGSVATDVIPGVETTTSIHGASDLEQDHHACNIIWMDSEPEVCRP